MSQSQLLTALNLKTSKSWTIISSFLVSLEKIFRLSHEIDSENLLIIFRHVHNRRNQYYLHHSGSSSECPTKKSTENLAKDGNEEEQERSHSNDPANFYQNCLEKMT